MTNNKSFFFIISLPPIKSFWQKKIIKNLENQYMIEPKNGKNVWGYIICYFLTCTRKEVGNWLTSHFQNQIIVRSITFCNNVILRWS